MKGSLRIRIGLKLLSLLMSTVRVKCGDVLPSRGVVVFWHGNMLPVWWKFRNIDAVAVVSKSPDGEILSMWLTKLGYQLIRGSSSTNGSIVLNTMASAAQRGLVFVTPDGPRGPARFMKPGALITALRTSNSLVLCSVEFSAAFRFSSWDGMQLPCPFSQVKITLSQVSSFPDESNRSEIESMLDQHSKLMK